MHSVQIFNTPWSAEVNPQYLIKPYTLQLTVVQTAILEEVEEQHHDLQEFHTAVIVALQCLVVPPLAHAHDTLEKEFFLKGEWDAVWNRESAVWHRDTDLLDVHIFEVGRIDVRDGGVDGVVRVVFVKEQCVVLRLEWFH